MSTPRPWPRALCDAEAAPPPEAAARVRSYSPYEVVAINLWIDRHRYRAVAMAHYDTSSGRRAYQLCLWPALPDGVRTGWYWWDPDRMRRRDFTR
ncbi:hypothetical protein ACFWXK_24955 [Streptomyces sp. NPDC059070]|uniref:hypothetical protein n=1 Tax=Streptomyces sp. NPDC059070 TaxID=3346713 RepID=UPI0036A7B9A7